MLSSSCTRCRPIFMGDYGILAYDNAGPQDSARSGFPRTARVARTGAINSLMARIVNDGESVREDVPPAHPALST